MVELAEKARRNGLLALEEDVAKIDDAFTRKGLQLVVDGTDSDLVHAILESEIDGMAAPPRAGGADSSRPPAASRRRSASSAPSWASSTCSRTSPTPAELGHAIAGAFIATLYGVGSANLHLPADRATSSRRCRRTELNYRTMLLEAILSIQAGDNPRVLAEKLETFVAAGRPRRRGDEAEGGASLGGAARKRHERPRAAVAERRRGGTAAATRAATSAGSSPTPT